jgi:hypothetical protein
VGVPAPKAELSDGLVDGSKAGDNNPRLPDVVSDIRFATPRDGWAFGGALWETHDGGATWREVRGLKGRVLDLAVDGDHVDVVTSSCLGDKCPFSAQVVRGKVGGGSFTAVGGLRLSNVPYANFASGSGTLTLMTGLSEEAVSYAARDGRYSAITSPCPPEGGDPYGVLAGLTPPASGGKGLIGFCARGAAGHQEVVTRVSTDGGRSWTTTGTRLRLTNEEVSFTAVSVDTLLASSGSPDLGGTMNRSTDGGKTWQVVPEPKPANGWRWVAAGGGNRVLALASKATGAVYLSTDGGATFTARPIR